MGYLIPLVLAVDFMPHGHCYFWQPGIISLHVISDVLIALAYFTISFTVVRLATQRSDLPFKPIFWAFGTFIVACGLTHVMEVWTLWYPSYWLAGGVKAATALVSIATSIMLVPLLPKALALPSPRAPREANTQLVETGARFKQALEQLQLQQSIFQHMKKGLLLVRERDEVIVFANRFVETLLGYEEGALLGRTSKSLNFHGGTPMAEALRKQFRAGTGEVVFDVTMMSRTKLPVFCHATTVSFEHPEHGRVWASHFDDRRDEMRALMADVVASTGEAVVAVSPEGRVQTWNQGAERLYGYLAAEAIGEPFETLTGARLATSTTSAFGVVEAQHRAKSGVMLDVVVTTAEIRDETGALTAISTLIHDVSLLKRHERALAASLLEKDALLKERAQLFAAENEARAHAEAASRTKDEFLAMLGHELRNPLAPIVTALSLMERRDGAVAQRERNIIARQVKHLTRLVDDLLDVSRITQGKVELKRERLELATVVSRAVELASPLLEERQQHLSVTVPAQGLLVDADPVRLAQVVSNLLTNSAKYTPPGGHIEVSGVREGERAVLAVHDAGAGISAQMLPRVFDLFAQEPQSIDRARGGLGLGLAVVKSLVSLHGGTVSAASEGKGRGSTFTITLPLATALEAPAQAKAAPGALAAGRALRVLVVDDNLDAAELLAEAVTELGYAVKFALDGPAALEVAQRFRPQIAVLDLGLPLMDGYELARTLREEVGPLKLIALTGYGQAADFQRTREAGFNQHLVKPVDFDALQAALEAQATAE